MISRFQNGIDPGFNGQLPVGGAANFILPAQGFLLILNNYYSLPDLGGMPFLLYTNTLVKSVLFQSASSK